MSIHKPKVLAMVFSLAAVLLLSGCPIVGLKTSVHLTNSKQKRVIFISAESQYKAAETLPEFAHELQVEYNSSCEIIQGSTDRDSENRNHISGMETLVDADLVVLFVRRRAFPTEQMKYFRDYLERGKPLIALRTASHAFDTRGNVPDGHVEWRSFDPEVLGGNYHGHYGTEVMTTITVAVGAENHQILTDIQTPFTSNSSLYRTIPLSKTAKPLLIGEIAGHEPEPVAWTNTYKNAHVFYTSLGHPDDFDNPQFRRLLVNAVFWAMDKSMPSITEPQPSRSTRQ